MVRLSSGGEARDATYQGATSQAERDDGSTAQRHPPRSIQRALRPEGPGGQGQRAEARPGTDHWRSGGLHCLQPARGGHAPQGPQTKAWGLLQHR